MSRRLERRTAWPALAAFVVLALNLADGALTHRFLLGGQAREANPLMRLSWEASPAAFWGVKLAVVALAAAFLATHGSRPSASVGLLFGVAAYAAVLAYHLVGVWNGVLLPVHAFP